MDMSLEMFSVQPQKTRPGDRMKNMSAVAVTWDDFTQNTTFHGIRYVFGNGLLLRKSVWIFCVTAAVVLFVVQVAGRTKTYYDYNTNVDVVVLYDKKIPFPAVTVCNQNTFRLTSAAEAHVYDLLHTLYTDNSLTEEELSLMYPEHAGKDMSEIARRTGHTMEDLIVSCWWRHKPCNISASFTTVYTEFGVCFTFNGPQGPDLMADKSGSKKGLSLKLNVEQYEYMVGPQSEIGVQVLLHDKSETPLMESLGFAVAPGTHTLVGIDRREEVFMKHPYGNCIPGAVPMTSCSDAARTNQQLTRCGCKGAFTFADEHTNITRCNVTSEFFCIDKLIDNDEGEDEDTDTDTCEVPCERTTYSYSLSYALLGQNNIKNVIYPDPVTAGSRLAALGHSVLQAFKTRHRYVPDVVQTDEGDLNAVTSSLGTMVQHLLDANSTIVTEGTLPRMFQIGDTLRRGDEILAADLETIRSSSRSQYRLFYVYMYDSVNWYFKDLEGEISSVWSSMSLCLTNVTLDLADMNSSALIVRNCHESIDGDILSRINNNYINKQYGYSIFVNIKEREIPRLLSDFDHILDDTGFNISAHPENNWCRDQIEQYSEFLDFVQTFFSLTLGLFSDNFTEAVVSGFNIQELQVSVNLSSTLPILSALRNEETQYCKWISKLTAVSQNKEEYSKYSLGIDRYTVAQRDHSSSWSTYKLMSSALVKSYAMCMEEIYPMTHAIAQYQMGAISMKQMAERLDPTLVKALLFDFSNLINEFVLLASDYERLVPAVVDNLKLAYGSMLSTTIPLMKYSTFFGLEIWTQLVKRSNASLIVSERESIESRSVWPPNMDTIIEELYHPFLEVPRMFSTNINDEMRSLLDSSVVMLDTLKLFNANTELSNDFFTKNFIEVDLFYKELKHQRVTQRPSFELMSLLSEVGGFLGLLLGASVLTVCEILDYILISFLARCRDAQSKKLRRGRTNVINVQPQAQGQTQVHSQFRPQHTADVLPV